MADCQDRNVGRGLRGLRVSRFVNIVVRSFDPFLEAGQHSLSGLLRDSIKHGLDHRRQALDYAQSYGRGLDTALADRFVGMYVNDWTIDFGPRGRKAVEVLLAEGFKAGIIPKLVVPEFVDETL